MQAKTPTPQRRINSLQACRVGLWPAEFVFPQPASLNTVYDRTCSSKSARDEKESGLSFSAVVQAIPVNFRSNTKSAREMVEDFCRLYTRTEEQSSARYAFESRIVSEGLKTVSACVEIAGAGTSVTPQFTGRGILSFTVKSRDAGNPLGIDHVYKGDAKCTGKTPDGKQTINFDDAMMPVSTVGNESFGFTCSREGEAEGNTKKYREATVVVYTNKGKYPMYWPEATVLSSITANELSQQVSALSKQIDQVHQRITNIKLVETAPTSTRVTGGESSKDPSPFEFIIQFKPANFVKDTSGMSWHRVLSLEIPRRPATQ